MSGHRDTRSTFAAALAVALVAGLVAAVVVGTSRYGWPVPVAVGTVAVVVAVGPVRRVFAEALHGLAVDLIRFLIKVLIVLALTWFLLIRPLQVWVDTHVIGAITHVTSAPAGLLDAVAGWLR